MSYILDALKKADRERTLGDVPDLETAHWGERRRGRSNRWVWIVAALLVVNGALLAFLLGRGGDKGSIPDPEIRADYPPVTATPVVPQADSSAVQPSRRITRPREPVYTPPPAPAPRQQPSVQYAPAPLDGSAPVTGQTAWDEPVVTDYQDDQQAAVAAASPEQMPAAVPVAGGVPYWDQLSLEFRSGLVLPHVDVHVYSNDPARRFILVDLEKYREGEALDNGLVIEMINEDSIQMNYRGTSFLVER